LSDKDKTADKAHVVDVSSHPESLQKLYSENFETADFVASYFDEKDKVKEVNLKKYQRTKEIPLFIQWDKQWGYLNYGEDIAGVNGDAPLCLAMAGYYLKNTLTDNGTVSRGVCEVDANGQLIDVVERTKIKRVDGKISYTEDEENWTALPEDVLCSMNCWCFPASVIDEIEAYLIEFLKNEVPANPLKSEFFLPFLVRDLLKEGKCTVDVLETKDKWFGVTYKEDKPDVVKSVQALVDDGVYPEKLW
jgi:hypothetical protein